MEPRDRIYECNAPGVIFEQFEDETVVINLDSGHYYTLNAAGAAVWTRINESVALDALVAEQQRAYDGPPEAIAHSIREFISLLIGEQLIRPVVSQNNGAGGQAASTPPAGARTSFQAPELTKYNDMAEMLLLDPVHDVDAAGWPSAPPANADTGATTARIEADDVSEWPDLERKS